MVVAVIAVVVFSGGSGKGSTAAGKCPKPDGSSPRRLSFRGPPPTCLHGTNANATFTTSAGKIVVALDLSKTPRTANNFAVLAGWHYYDHTKLFRIDPSIDIVQGGSPRTESADDPGPGYTIEDEGRFTTDPATGDLKGPYRYRPGDLVMARAAGPDSAAAQFFFVTGDKAAAGLDASGTYVVFGHVTAGMDVLEKIARAPTKPLPGGLGNTPDPPITLTSVRVASS